MTETAGGKLCEDYRLKLQDDDDGGDDDNDDDEDEDNTWCPRLGDLKSLPQGRDNVTHVRHGRAMFTQRLEQCHLVNVLQSSTAL